MASFRPNSEPFLRPNLDKAAFGSNPRFPGFLSGPPQSNPSKYIPPETTPLPNHFIETAGGSSTCNCMHFSNSTTTEAPLVDPSTELRPASAPEKQCQMCTNLDRRFEGLEKEIRLLKVNIERPINTDGTFIWSIDNVSKRKEENPGGYLESATFFTAMFGYKLQGSIYLKGDGEESGKNLSVYIVILKGEHDSLLKWSFQHPVSIILMDQSSRKLNITKKFHPTQSSSCFKQPLDATQRPTGFPDFIPLSDLKEPFLVDDVMFIKFIIHTL